MQLLFVESFANLSICIILFLGSFSWEVDLEYALSYIHNLIALKLVSLCFFVLATCSFLSVYQTLKILCHRLKHVALRGRWSRKIVEVGAETRSHRSTRVKSLILWAKWHMFSPTKLARSRRTLWRLAADANSGSYAVVTWCKMLRVGWQAFCVFFQMQISILTAFLPLFILQIWFIFVSRNG